jgi:phenylalanyl-tRNA synthetase beta chain
MPGLLNSLLNNLTRQTHDVALFEIGRVFSPGQAERRTVAILLTGNRQAAFWQGEGAKFDAMDLKAVVEELLKNLGVFGVQYERRAQATALFFESAEVKMGKNVIGQMGLLLPPLGKQFEARDSVYLAELDLDTLLQCRTAKKSFKPLPQFPASERDVAMLVPEAVTHADVLAVVKRAKPANLVATQLFDVFRGKNVPDGQKSLAYSFTYRHAEKTLTDKDVNGAHDALVAALKENLSATIRDT